MATAFVARHPIGTFALSDKGDLLFYELASKNVEIALRMFNAPLSDEIKKNLDGYEIKEGGYELLRKQIREYAVSLGFVKNDKELNNFLYEFGVLFSKNKMKGVIGRDALLVQASNGLQDLSKIINLMDERLYEWFSLHYPEVERGKMIDFVLKHGSKKDATGVDIDKKDVEMFKTYAKMLKETENVKRNQEKYIRELAKEVAPNICALIDPLLAARVIASAGSLEKMAKLPASAIQLLGAEKALFRHLRKQGRAPKYGILFTSSWVQGADNDKKGKVARMLAAKLMLAARMDFYSGRDDGKNLREQLDKEIKKR